LEDCEAELRGKEDELFSQLERNLRLEEEIERAKTERSNYIEAQNRLEKQRETAFRRLQMQLDQNEITRQDLERARLDVIRQATIIRSEKDTLEEEVNAYLFTQNRKIHRFRSINISFTIFSAE